MHDSLNRWQQEVADYDRPHLRLRQVAHLVNRERPASVLDLGCARGTLRHLIDASRYVGCDFVESAGDPFEFYRCDFNEDPLPVALPVADVAVCSGLLEYIADVPALLTQLREHVTPAGRLVTSYVNMNHVLRIADLIRGKTIFRHPDWLNAWSPADAVRQIEAGGFRVVETYETSRGVLYDRGLTTTADRPIRLRAAGTTSRLFAHQLIYVAVPA